MLLYNFFITLYNQNYLKIFSILSSTLQAFVTSKSEYKTMIQKYLSEAGCPKGIEFYQKTTSGEKGQGLMYRKNFKYGKTISYAIRELYQSLDFETLNTKWDSEFKPVCEKRDKIVPFGWEYFSGILVIVGVTTIAGCIMNIFEYIFVYFYKRKAFNINTPKELQEKKNLKDLQEKQCSTGTNKQKLVSANRALSAYLKDTIALEDHSVFSYQIKHKNEQFTELRISLV